MLARVLRGRDEVADLLRTRSNKRQPIPLRGLAVTRSSITAEFDDPWWDEQRRWRRRLESALGATYTQTLTLTGEGQIERIDSKQRFMAHTPDHSNRRDLLDLLLMR